MHILSPWIFLLLYFFGFFFGGFLHDRFWPSRIRLRCQLNTYRNGGIVNKKVFIFALDGVPLNLARKLAREGVMPNLARVLSKSSWGNLESTLPCITGPAWASFATGKNPGETGIFNFLQPAGDLDNLDIIDIRDIQGNTFYDIL